jgi:non-heme chloroperoxidase
MLFFLQHGYRVIAHDRRGHGRSTRTSSGHDMDHYADDLAAVTAHLDLHDAINVGHSTGGGEVARYLARHGESRVARAVLISSVPPLSSCKPRPTPAACPRASSAPSARWHFPLEGPGSASPAGRSSYRPASPDGTCARRWR